MPDRSPPECANNQTSTALLLWKGGVTFAVPLAFIGLVFSVTLALLIVYGRRRRRLKGNLYYYLLSRSFGDFLATLSIVTIRPLAYEGILSVETINVGVIGLSFSFFISASAYTCLSAMKLCAIRWPFNYRRYVTRKTVMVSVVGAWALALLVSVIELTFLLSYFERIHLVNCSYVDCVLVAQYSTTIVSAINYTTVLTLYLITVYSLKKARDNRAVSFKGMVGAQDRVGSGICLMRLSTNVIVYLALGLSEAPGNWLAVSLSPLVKRYGICIFGSQAEADDWSGRAIVVTVCTFALLLRIVVDASLNIVWDRNIRKLLVDIMTGKIALKLDRNGTVLSRSSHHVMSPQSRYGREFASLNGLELHTETTKLDGDSVADRNYDTVHSI